MNAKRVFKWIGNIITGIICIFLILVLFFAVSSKIHGGVPKIFGKEIYTVLSGSMEPGIKTGSIIADRPVANPLAEHFKVGDVVTFKSVDNASMLITHRIVEIKGSGNNMMYTTKGDNNDAKDPSPVPAGNVVGQYANFTIPYLGYFLSWVKTKLGIAIMMFIPGIVLIISPLVSLYKTMTKEEEQETLSNDSKTEAAPHNG